MRIERDSFHGVKVHVIGLGAYGTGRALARALWRRGAQVAVSDIKPADALADQIAALQDTEVEILTGEDAYRGIEEADLVAVSPGVPLDIPPLVRARERGARVVSDIEIAFLISRSPIIAVTGTKGKSTATALLGNLLNEGGRPALVGGNIGIPLVEVAERAEAEDLLVAEVSSFQLQATEVFRPWIAVLLNILRDHLDRHASFEEYREAKARIFANQSADDIAILNRDDAEAWAMRERVQAQVVAFSIAAEEGCGAEVREGWLRVRGAPVCPVEAVQLRGRHNLSNVLAALAAAGAAGADLGCAADTVSRFAPLEHRLEPVAEVGGVLFVNDSQATTPEAAVAAIESFDGHVVLIAGGRPKVDDFSGLAEAAARRGVSLVVIGEAGPAIARAAEAAGVPEIAAADSLPEAVETARRRARSGDVILLSPACASFDMFEDMAERGRIFKETVLALSRQQEKQQG